jgi:hypothetical protein
MPQVNTDLFTVTDRFIYAIGLAGCRIIKTVFKKGELHEHGLKS